MTRTSHSRSFWTFGLAALLFAGAMTALLWQREVGGVRNDLVVDSNLRLDEPIESWLGFYAGDPEPGNRVGMAHLTQEPEARDGLDGSRMTIDLELQLELFGRPADLNLEGSTWSPWRGQRLDFDFAVSTVGTEFAASGRVADGRLNGEVRNAGETLPLDLPLPDDVALQPSLAPAMQLPVLDLGQTIELPTFDPVTLGPGRTRVTAVRQQEVEVGGETLSVRVYRVRTSGFDTEAWVDDRGDIVRATTPLGLTIARMPGPPDAGDVGSALEDSALLRQTAVFPTGQTVRRRAERIVWNLSLPAPPPEFVLPSEDEAAASTGGSGPSATEDLELTRTPDDAFQQAELIEAQAANDGALQRQIQWRLVTSSAAEFDDRAPEDGDLAADLFVQSDHPKIRAAAADVFSQLDPSASDDAEAQARHLHEWVYANLDKVPVLGVPSALEVLEARRGDCNEHAILYTALARAHGLPTRIAAGLVWSDDLDGLYYHAWPEVWIGTGWRRYDPTLGQVSADATHIKLLEGGVERWPALLAFLGRVELEAISVQ